ncbi:hypothetical protein J8F10_12415 [Gemmata sp. G18]|uniref:Uncharacterized protein n=1 Tax=Gemmata palustris TaxID=2822762 RepID=A0ABS5BQU5_9BACT|nr:hypothetical protein [Gemmata palustris]MBP3956087.1 hypothetical protein [Gemmata palustris]
MRAPVTALAWEFWGRYRWGLSAFGLFVGACAGIAAAAPGANPRMFASLSSIWFAMGLGYLIVVFAYGSEVRLETADSGFPARFFLLPVRTWVLVGWPMLQGVLAAALAWVAWDQLVLRPCGIETPFWWLAMLAAVVVTIQAVLWVPFGLPWVRLPVALVVLTALVRAPVLLAVADERFAEPGTENTILTALAVVLIPVAFLVARAGVGRARCGDSPDWLRAIGALRRPRELRARRPFASPMSAQVWYEWRVRGLGFPLLVLFALSILVACALLLEPPGDRKPGFGVALLCIPPLMAAFCGQYMGAMGDITHGVFNLPAFAATRPMSNSALVSAKLRAAAIISGVTWALTVAVAGTWMAFTGGMNGLSQKWDYAVSALGTARACVFFGLIAIGPVFLIWRLLVENLWIGLTGRAWVAHAAITVAALVGVPVAYEWTRWGSEPARLDRIRAALPWAATGLIALKFLLAGAALRALHRRGELSTGAIQRVLGAWVLVVAGLFAALCWLVPVEWTSDYNLAAGVVLFVSLARLLVAPVALSWNRHR